MALQKTVETPFGVNADYWRIGMIQTHFVAKTIVVSMFGYIDKEARDNGKDCISSLQIGLEFKDTAVEVTRDMIYGMMKQDERFVGAIDA